MKSISVVTNTAAETVELGKKIAQFLRPGDILCLFGELGAGKTTFVRGLTQGLGADPANVNSPTFVLMNVYDGKMPVYHFDFYRLEKTNEIAAIGYDEFLYGQGVSVIEWAERFGSLIPENYLQVKLTHQGLSKRGMEFSAVGKRYEGVLRMVSES